MMTEVDQRRKLGGVYISDFLSDVGLGLRPYDPVMLKITIDKQV